MLLGPGRSKEALAFLRASASRGVMDLQEAVKGQGFAARASRRSFAARVSRSSGSDSFRNQASRSDRLPAQDHM